jgi:hypothetical protein
MNILVMTHKAKKIAQQRQQMLTIPSLSFYKTSHQGQKQFLLLTTVKNMVMPGMDKPTGNRLFLIKPISHPTLLITGC